MLGTRYGMSARILHHLALGVPFITEASFDIEQILLRPDPASVTDKKHVFITGLARAGTTLLMRRFYASKKYTSLTYRDMPFVLMPSLWRKATSSARQYSERQERVHGDGMVVDFDSPEALEEVFWRIFARDEYIRSDRLIPMTATDDLIDKFRAYLASILSGNAHEHAARYLSKNNNNILRLSSIKRAYPYALIIVLFRDPLQQAASLLRVHQRFVSEGNNDKFFCHYMRWLGHHEFGVHHRPFCFGEGRSQYLNPNDLNYWLELWLNTYRWVYRNAPESVVFLGYERFCADPDSVWAKLAEKACIPVETQAADKVVLKKKEVEHSVDKELLSAAKRIYELLSARWA